MQNTISELSKLHTATIAIKDQIVELVNPKSQMPRTAYGELPDGTRLWPLIIETVNVQAVIAYADKRERYLAREKLRHNRNLKIQPNWPVVAIRIKMQAEPDREECCNNRDITVVTPDGDEFKNRFTKAISGQLDFCYEWQQELNSRKGNKR